MSEEVIELPPDDLPEEEIAERDTFDCEEQVPRHPLSILLSSDYLYQSTNLTEYIHLNILLFLFQFLDL